MERSLRRQKPTDQPTNKEYLRCDFDINENEWNDGVHIRIGDLMLHLKESFRYLGLVLHKSGRIDEDVSHRINVYRLKWKVANRRLVRQEYPSKDERKIL